MMMQAGLAANPSPSVAPPLRRKTTIRAALMTGWKTATPRTPLQAEARQPPLVPHQPRSAQRTTTRMRAWGTSSSGMQRRRRRREKGRREKKLDLMRRRRRLSSEFS